MGPEERGGPTRRTPGDRNVEKHRKWNFWIKCEVIRGGRIEWVRVKGDENFYEFAVTRQTICFLKIWAI